MDSVIHIKNELLNYINIDFFFSLNNFQVKVELFMIADCIAHGSARFKKKSIGVYSLAKANCPCGLYIGFSWSSV